MVWVKQRPLVNSRPNLRRTERSVLLGAADTFRAAAVEQLKLWGERVGVPVIAKGMNTDPSAVAFDAVKEGVETGRRCNHY